MINSKFLIIVPLLFSVISSYICKLDKNTGQNVKFRPPPYLFGIIWGILYVCIGISWYNAVNHSNNILLTNTLYISIIISLFSWIYIYECMAKKKEASWFFIIIITLVLFSLMSGPLISRLLMCPLLAWCCFALIMNTTEIQYI